MSKVTIISSKELLTRIKSNIEECISFLDTEIGITESVIPFLEDEHNKVEGAFLANHKAHIIYSKVVPPAEIESSLSIGIFQWLKKYGSSGKYKGVIDGEGKSKLPNIYLSIEPFINDILKVQCKNSKFGLIRISGEFILDPVYDRIDSLGELVFAVCKDGKLGFMNLNGEVEIPFIYEVPEEGEEIVFYNGLACVLQQNSDGEYRYGYINHKNQEVIPFEFSYNEPFKNCDTLINCKYYKNGYDDSVTDECVLSLDGSVTLINTTIHENNSWMEDYEIIHAFDESRKDNDDWLDAFEGDASNRWNTD